VVSNPRYSTTSELRQLTAVSPPLGRPEATRAALIPIKKSEAWWTMGQDERRAIFEEQSGHISRSMRHVPAVARRLHHSRDLGEPFDFVTWFEYAPQHAEAFEDLVAELRATPEWRFVEREVDVRLVRR
jgi:chlorite dismutase